MTELSCAMESRWVYSHSRSKWRCWSSHLHEARSWVRLYAIQILGMNSDTSSHLPRSPLLALPPYFALVCLGRLFFAAVGNVSQITQDDVQCLVLGVWLATIPKNKLMEGGEIVQSATEDIDDAIGNVLRIKDVLRPDTEPKIVQVGHQLKFMVER